MKTYSAGEQPPYGIFWCIDQFGGGRKLSARLPMSFWHGEVYEAWSDRVLKGWKVLDGYVRVSKSGSRVEIIIAWGWRALPSAVVIKDGWSR